MPVANADSLKDNNNIHISPLQMAVAAASLSNNGIRPTPRIALAVDTPQQGWIVLPALGTTNQIFSPEVVNDLVQPLAVKNSAYWEWSGIARSNQEISTWYLAGTIPNWKGTPLTLVVLIEGDDQITSQNIGRQLIQSSMKP
jgi:hypothetical protein